MWKEPCSKDSDGGGEGAATVVLGKGSNSGSSSKWVGQAAESKEGERGIPLSLWGC